MILGSSSIRRLDFRKLGERGPVFPDPVSVSQDCTYMQELLRPVLRRCGLGRMSYHPHLPPSQVKQANSSSPPDISSQQQPAGSFVDWSFDSSFPTRELGSSKIALKSTSYQYTSVDSKDMNRSCAECSSNITTQPSC